MAKASNRSLYYSDDYDESDSCDSVYDGNSGCSQFYRHTQAKVRFTRTTSKIQHHLEASRIDGGSRSHLFGCLRRTSSSKSLTSLYLERNHGSKDSRMATEDDEHHPPTTHYKWNDGLEPIFDDGRRPEKTSTAADLFLSTEKRRQELERTREEIKRLDALLLKQKEQELAFESQQCTSSTLSPPPGQQQHYSSLTSIPDEWIDQLSSPTTGAAAQQDDDLAFESSSSSSSSCWDWCIKSGPSSWPPHVDLEPFTGEAKDWPKFIQRFKVLIHDAMPNDTLRMIYLEELIPTAVKDEYYTLFGHLSCYPLLLAHLKDYFGSPHIVARSCFRALKQLPSVDQSINTKTIQDFISQLDDVVATLRLIGFEEDLRAFATLELTGIVEKLPEQLRRQWNLYLVKRPPLPNLVEFTSWLKEKTETATCWR